ncbi:hypothetical protein WMY93_001827 [Mugilogobius chulae]|uniref:FERM domain-containing protein n=1 Tax=Mugilogobius chulae TaxID=88201 RepID=A0AAW0PRV9_9GOBI
MTMLESRGERRGKREREDEGEEREREKGGDDREERDVRWERGRKREEEREGKRKEEERQRDDVDEKELGERDGERETDEKRERGSREGRERVGERRGERREMKERERRVERGERRRKRDKRGVGGEREKREERLEGREMGVGNMGRCSCSGRGGAPRDFSSHYGADREGRSNLASAGGGRFASQPQLQGQVLCERAQQTAGGIPRYQYFLQIKQDIQTGRLPCPHNTAALLASYAVQSELGDYNEEEHPVAEYLSEFSFIPNPPQDFHREVCKHHQQHSGLSPAQAEFQYLNTARSLELYGVELHWARDQSQTEILLGVQSGGILVYKNRVRINYFPWLKIVKISFKCKQFFIQLRREVLLRDRGHVEADGRGDERRLKSLEAWLRRITLHPR